MREGRQEREGERTHKITHKILGRGQPQYARIRGKGSTVKTPH